MFRLLIVTIDGKQIDHFNSNYVSRIGESIEIRGSIYNVKNVTYIAGLSYIKIEVSGPF